MTLKPFVSIGLKICCSLEIFTAGAVQADVSRARRKSVSDIRIASRQSFERCRSRSHRTLRRARAAVRVRRARDSVVALCAHGNYQALSRGLDSRNRLRREITRKRKQFHRGTAKQRDTCTRPTQDTCTGTSSIFYKAPHNGLTQKPTSRKRGNGIETHTASANGGHSQLL